MMPAVMAGVMTAVMARMRVAGLGWALVGQHPPSVIRVSIVVVGYDLQSLDDWLPASSAIASHAGVTRAVGFRGGDGGQ